jgi:hypothetical protein
MKRAYTKPVLTRQQKLADVTAFVASPKVNGAP